MKKALLIAATLALGVVASQAQGLVSISLTGGILASTNIASASITGKIAGTGTAGYYFELLYSSNLGATTAADVTQFGTSQWTDAGVFGSSGGSIAAGKITAQTSASANGWTAPDATYDNERAVDVVGWSAVYGQTYAAFLTSLGSGLTPYVGFYGFATGLNYAGGGSSSLNAVDQWGNSTGLSGAGLTSGIVLNQVVPTPEPGTMAMAALGGLSLLAFRRKK